MKKIIVSLIVGILTAAHIQAQNSDNTRAQWISGELCNSATNTWLIYRKTVHIDNIPRSLIANIAADSKYWLWINGQMVVFEGGLKRTPSPYDTYYDPVEIAPFLQIGENTIAVLVWHFGKSGFSHNNSGLAAFFFEATSPEINILSDDSWESDVYTAYQNTMTPPNPNWRLAESNILFDARKEKLGWNLPGYRGVIPKAIVVSEVGVSPFGKLIKRPIPLWKDYGLRPYISIRYSANKDTVYCRLPYNCQITPYLKVEAPAGKKINIRTDNYCGGFEYNVRAEYITRNGLQEYESYGWMNGHEVQYIIPKGVKIVSLKFRETGYNTEISGNFYCNDPFLNELWKRSARTLYITMRDNYMDCPDRERAQWWGDEVNELGEAFYALSPSSYQLALKGVYELINWQKPNGIFFSPIPGNRRELPLQTLATIGWYGFYTLAFYSGDNSFIPDIYDRIHRYLHEVWKINEKGLVIERKGDWNWGDWGENIDMGVLTNCWYYLALKAEREFARQLGKSSDVEEISSLMRGIEKEFDSEFWTGTCYRSPLYTHATDDRAQAMAVVSGLASSDKYPQLLEIFKNEYHASPYMEKYVLEALFIMNEPSFALYRMKKRYSKMLSYKDYTTLFEGWGIGQEGFGGGTINHAWSGGPLTLLSQKVCGITPITPGFKVIRVAPQMGDLTNASATIETIAGKVQVVLKRKKNQIHMSLCIPDGITIEVPYTKDKIKILNSGRHNLTISNSNN